MTRTLREDLPLLLLRLAGLGLALGHGWGKVVQLAAGEGQGFVEAVGRLGFPLPGLFAWAAALAELVGGLLIAFGLFTRVAAAFAAFTMLIAAFLRHKAHLHLLVSLGLLSASKETVESWRSPELALTYLVILLAVALLGPGRLSLDARR